MPITIEIRRELVEGFVPLSLVVARRLVAAGLPFAEALNCKVNIYRLTSFYDGETMPDHFPPDWRDERWESLLAELHEIFRRHEADSDTAAVEREGYELLRPVLEPAFERDVARWPRLEDRPYGFFTCNISRKVIPGRDVLGLHLANPFAPASPFADPRARADELRRLIRDARREHPDLTHIGTASWLNSLAPFLDLFPPEWAAAARPFPRLVPGMGWWGQFFDRRGGFHRTNAGHLRRTGRFPYPVMDCHCRIDVLEDHLTSKFGLPGGRTA